MRKTIVIGLFAFAVSSISAAENLAKFAGCEDPAVFKKCGAGVALSTDKPHSGKTSLRIANKMRLQ